MLRIPRFPPVSTKKSIISTLSHAVEGIQALLGANIGSLDSKVKCDSQSQSEEPEEPATARHAIIKDRAAEGTTSISSTRKDDCRRWQWEPDLGICSDVKDSWPGARRTDLLSPSVSWRKMCIWEGQNRHIFITVEANWGWNSAGCS